MREQFLQRRRTLMPDQLARARADVRAAVLDRAAAAGWRTVAAYRPLRTEPGSVELLQQLTERGVRLLVPVTLPDRDLDWVALPGDRPVGMAGIGAADAVLVPALAVAADGTRLGRGGGSYDRALARSRPGVPIAALLYDQEFVAELPRDPWDRPVTAYVTPSGGWCEIGVSAPRQ